MAQDYKKQKEAIIYISKVIDLLQSIKQININHFYLDILKNYEISETFVKKTLQRYIDLNVIYIKEDLIIFNENKNEQINNEGVKKNE